MARLRKVTCTGGARWAEALLVLQPLKPNVVLIGAVSRATLAPSCCSRAEWNSQQLQVISACERAHRWTAALETGFEAVPPLLACTGHLY